MHDMCANFPHIMLIKMSHDVILEISLADDDIQRFEYVSIIEGLMGNQDPFRKQHN